MDAVKRIYWEYWLIGADSKRETRESILSAFFGDDDDDDDDEK